MVFENRSFSPVFPLHDPWFIYEAAENEDEHATEKKKDSRGHARKEWE